MRSRAARIKRKVQLSILPFVFFVLSSAASGSDISTEGYPELLGQILRPNRGLPVIQEKGAAFAIEIRETDPGLTNWSARLTTREGFSLPLDILRANCGPGMIYNKSRPGWRLLARIPADAPEDLYDLTVRYDGGDPVVEETNARAVKVVARFREAFSFIHITDIHLFLDGYREMMTEKIIGEINLINPEFVVITGDIADFAEGVFRIEEILDRFNVPVYCLIGNHERGFVRNWTPPTLELWEQYYGQLYYAFDYGSNHFICFNHTFGGCDWDDDRADPGQLAWAEEDLDRHSSGDTFGFAHHFFHRRDPRCGRRLPHQINDEVHHLLYDNGEHPAAACFYGHVNDPQEDEWYEPKRLYATHSGLNAPDHGYRLVRVPIRRNLSEEENAPLVPAFEITRRFTRPNDGTVPSNAVLVKNGGHVPYDHSLVKFVMPQGDYDVFGGDLFQALDTEDKTVCYVHLEIPVHDPMDPGDFSSITIKPREGPAALAAITSPPPGSCHTGSAPVDVLGFAPGKAFTLMCGEGFTPDHWHVIARGATDRWETPVHLGSRTLPDNIKSPWTIKLTVEDSDGGIHEDRVLIYVDTRQNSMQEKAFTDIAGTSNADGVHGSGENSQGAACGDFDGDGDLDLYVANFGYPHHQYGAGHANTLFRRLRIGKRFEDATSLIENGDITCWGKTAFFFDYDNDGDPDLYGINNRRYGICGGEDCGNDCADHQGRNIFYENNGAAQSFSFSDITETLNLADDGYGLGGTILDYDNDGFLDILLVNNDGPVLYRNNGPDLEFTDVTQAAGLLAPFDVIYTDAAAGDYDGDHDPDIYLTSTRKWYVAGLGCPETAENILYRNKGDGTFENVTDEAGVGANGFILPWRNLPDPCAGMNYASAYSRSAAWGDYDNDGDLDLVVFNFQDRHLEAYPIQTANRGGLVEPLGNLLYQNNGDGTFEDVTESTGITGGRWSLGGDFLDFDHDGDLDIFISAEGANLLYLNQGDGTFSDISEISGLIDWIPGAVHPGLAKPCAIGDFTEDNRLDIFQPRGGFSWRLKQDYRYKNVLFKNTMKSLNHVVKVKTIGRVSNRMGIGARIEFTCGDITQLREISVGNGGSQREAAAYFGLGKNTRIAELRITWPSTRIQTIEGIDINPNGTTTLLLDENDAR